MNSKYQLRHLKYLALLALTLCLCATSLQAASTQILAFVTYTNMVRGVTNGDTITVNADVRRYTNGTLNSDAGWILSTNVPGWAATNTASKLGNFSPTGTEWTGTTNTNTVTSRLLILFPMR